jgi:diketogulonate reductase-like aldo/keto reductase
MQDKLIPVNDLGIPILGFGTWPLTGREAEETVAMALEAGHRHIDTAQMYGNEKEVGVAVGRSGLPRDEIFVTTKVDPSNLGPERFLSSVERSLEALDTEAVDLLLIHWPPAEASAFNAALDSLNAAIDRGFTRRIGISNFTVGMIERAVARSSHALATNQVEFHPLLDQSRLLEAARQAGLCLTAYCPLARGAVFGDPVIGAIAGRSGRSEAEVVLRWILQQGVVAVPMTTKRENALSNLAVLDFELSDADMGAITELTAQNRRVVSPDNIAPDWDA